MKNIVVGVLTLFIVGLMVFTAMDDAVFHGGHQAKVIEDFGDGSNQKVAAIAQVEEKSDREKEDEELKALRDKAGNAGAFKVSNEYKSKCSSCHGVNGSGFQNGKAMMGPPIFGQSEEEIYTSLVDFKAGRKENMVMKGLLMHLEDEDLKRFAKEIGEFPARAKEEQN
ncbi:MAG: c-type cytochrome [Sulfurimonas sp.]|uniref:c-type cytochrome n=1 Tax=Sulfurimonas sp. TaxID=2022749 RepID=UPI0025FC4174|nr:c-type cytochrome [Sulfurimonas sp.]MCK9490977.1 c-type cytochrome [Sulfurimonas sp.]